MEKDGSFEEMGYCNSSLMEAIDCKSELADCKRVEVADCNKEEVIDYILEVWFQVLEIEKKCLGHFRCNVEGVLLLFDHLSHDMEHLHLVYQMESSLVQYLVHVEFAYLLPFHLFVFLILSYMHVFFLLQERSADTLSFYLGQDSFRILLQVFY